MHLIDDDVAVVPGNDGRHDEGDGALVGDPSIHRQTAGWNPCCGDPIPSRCRGDCFNGQSCGDFDDDHLMGAWEFSDIGMSQHFEHGGGLG
ncbi:MAG: hypothetical protein ACOY4D_12175 [Pseudomonadota bacterium]